jgi:hypothetical protein
MPMLLYAHYPYNAAETYRYIFEKLVTLQEVGQGPPGFGAATAGEQGDVRKAPLGAWEHEMEVEAPREIASAQVHGGARCSLCG